MSTKPLTKPQEALLSRVRAAGVLVQNGRARRTVEALERAGLVTVEYDQVAHATGNGISISERFTMRPVSKVDTESWEMREQTAPDKEVDA